MDSQSWLLRQEPKWHHLEALLARAEQRGLSHLSAQELQEFSALYRTVSADLSRAKTRQLGKVTTSYLQQLTLRAYQQIYQGKQRQPWQEIGSFYNYGWPAIVRLTGVETLVATAVALFGAAVGWWYAWRDPEFLQAAVPPQILDLVQNQGKLWMGSIVGIEPLASSGIMTNNISVTFATLCGGLLAGLGTLFILWNNGLLIGTLATLVGQHNLAYPFWAFVFPHGSLELPAIFFAGGAGLRLARGLLFPGRHRRLIALKQAGAEAIQIMFGVVPLLVIAGIIEGFFSPNPAVPDSLKYLVGTLLFAGLLLYISRRRKLA